MRKLILLPAVLLVLAGCSTEPAPTASTTTIAETAPAETSTTRAITVPPQLADHDIDLVPVGDELMLLAIADSPSLRAQGLQGVTDLGDLDGMLFYWRHVANGAFWMKDTLIPLDIVWFLEDGTYAGRASMVPCEADPCETYAPAGNPDFRYAIEANPGDLDWINEDTVIVFSD